MARYKQKPKKERIGETKTNKQGLIMKIVEYNNCSNIIIEFEIDGYRKKTTYECFKKNQIHNPNFPSASYMTQKEKMPKRLGEQRYNNDGELMTIVEYNNSSDIVIEFENGHRKRTTYRHFKYRNPVDTEKIGKLKQKQADEENKRKQERLKKIQENKEKREILLKEKQKKKQDFINSVMSINIKSKHGYSMKVIEYFGKTNVTIELDNGFIKTNVDYNKFINDNVSTPYNKTVCNIGYIGVGNYTQIDRPDLYKRWVQMIQRCYLPDDYRNTVTPYKQYIGCSVCDEWHCFQNFCEWWESNIYECPDPLNLDKDIKIKGNKIYSPDTCLIVPARINKLFIRNDR